MKILDNVLDEMIDSAPSEDAKKIVLGYKDSAKDLHYIRDVLKFAFNSLLFLRRKCDLSREEHFTKEKEYQEEIKDLEKKTKYLEKEIELLKKDIEFLGKL